MPIAVVAINTTDSNMWSLSGSIKRLIIRSVVVLPQTAGAKQNEVFLPLLRYYRLPLLPGQTGYPDVQRLIQIVLS